MKARFYGGSMDGKVMDPAPRGRTYHVPIREHVPGHVDEVLFFDPAEAYEIRAPKSLRCETYVIDRSACERGPDGDITMLAYKLESAEVAP